jgi:[ribosomal protein S18]-alanine N-acetyltransferase
VQVRRAISADIPAMIELERQSSNAAHWTLGLYEARVAGNKPPRAESLALVAEDEPKPADAVASCTPRIIAFLVAHRVDTEWELENIVVAENLRRRGVGLYLAKKFIEHARGENGNSIFLEVRESNQAARALYRKLGFEEAGRRRGYYSNPPEEAIVCRINL